MQIANSVILYSFWCVIAFFKKKWPSLGFLTIGRSLKSSLKFPNAVCRNMLVKYFPFFSSGVTLTVTAVEVDEQLTNLQDSLSLSRTMWKLINEWVNVKQKWVVIPVEMLEISKIQQHTQKMQEAIYSLESGTCVHTLYHV